MQLAVIGAGVAGLVAARALRQRRPELALAVFEKSRGLGGRVATRRREGFAFDHGAQNLRAPGAAVARLLIEQLDTSLLRAIELPVWVFDDPDVLLAPDNRIDIPTLEADVDVPVIGVKRGDVNHSAVLGCQ